MKQMAVLMSEVTTWNEKAEAAFDERNAFY